MIAKPVILNYFQYKLLNWLFSHGLESSLRTETQTLMRSNVTPINLIIFGIVHTTATKVVEPESKSLLEKPYFPAKSF